MWIGPFVRLGWRALAPRILLALGLASQLLLLWLAGELLDLYIAAVELWADLARKHLEVTLSSIGPAVAGVPWAAADDLSRSR